MPKNEREAEREAKRLIGVIPPEVLGLARRDMALGAGCPIMETDYTSSVSVLIAGLVRRGWFLKPPI